jgi:hypothetical protein
VLRSTEEEQARPGSDRGRRRLVAVAMAALLAYLATDGLVPLITNDTYLHLTTGRLILEQGSVPQSDSYSFTALGNRYVAHEWLAAVLYAVAEKVGGPPAVVVAGKLSCSQPWQPPAPHGASACPSQCWP